MSAVFSSVEILKRYEFTCVLCLGRATAVHEIVPKSKKPTDWWAFDNRVPLCQTCHSRVHEEGTRLWESRLVEARVVLASLLGVSSK